MIRTRDLSGLATPLTLRLPRPGSCVTSADVPPADIHFGTAPVSYLQPLGCQPSASRNAEVRCFRAWILPRSYFGHRKRLSSESSAHNPVNAYPHSETHYSHNLTIPTPPNLTPRPPVCSFNQHRPVIVVIAPVLVAASVG